MSKTRFLPRSLRWRLQLWLAFLLVAVLAGFGFTVYQLQKTNSLAQVDRDLEARLSALAGSLRELYLLQAPKPEEQRSEPRSDRRPPFRDGRPGYGPRRGPPPDGDAAAGREFDGPGRHSRGPGDPNDRRFDGPPRDRGPDEPDGGGHEGRDFREHGPGGRGFDKGPPPHQPVHFEKQKRPAPAPPRPTDLKLSAETAALFGDRPADFYYVVWYRDGSVLKRSANAPADLARPDEADRDTLPHLRTRQGFREAIHCSGMGDCVIAGRSVAKDLKATKDFAWALLAAAAAILALALGVGFWFTTRAIRPIETISAAASRISHGNLSQRVDGAESGDELGNLAAVLNSTFARLESAFERQKQFTADAAHELRTPLAVIISETQMTLARERSAADYRESVVACLETAQQMRRLTESLLDLARFEGAGDHPQAEVDLAETVRVAVNRIRPLAERSKISIEVACASALAFTNADRIGQVLVNLLTNAIDYNRPSGSVRVATSSDGVRAMITVADTGVGIADADLEHIFERFYRVDRARSRAAGHTGLGLAICKAIVEGEGGTIEASSVPGEGTTFTVKLPSKLSMLK